MNICENCNKEFIYKIHVNTKKKCNSCLSNSKRYEKKKKYVEYLGGKCSICGYNKSIYALQFHHKDPKDKKFTISGNHCRSWQYVKEELDKCILLCANCHAELHYGA